MFLKIQGFLGIILILNFVNLYAMKSEGDDIEKGKTVQKLSPTTEKSNDGPNGSSSVEYLTKSAFVAGSTVFFSRRCEEWAVDYATDVIQNTITSKNFLLNLTLSSAIRGKTIQEALPVAQQRGRELGIAMAVIAAPIVWDCGSAYLRSCGKIGRFVFEDEVPDKEKPTKRDWLKAGLGTATIIGAIGYLIKTYFKS